MANGLGQTDGGRRLLTGCVALLALFSLLPLSVTSWVSLASRVPRSLVIPASSQLTKLATWIDGPTQRRGDLPNPQDVQRTLLEQQTIIAQLLAENERLQRQLHELGAIIKLGPGASSVRTLVAPVVGSFSQTPGSVIRVKAGSSDGVTLGTVAVGPLLQIIGFVTEVEARTCTVLLLTAKDPLAAKDKDKSLKALVMISEGESLRCMLSPAAGGVLKGDIEWLADAAARERLIPQAGQYVRLDAVSPWPRAAHMLIVGTVESVENSTKAPGRKAVVVRPTIDPLSRVGEVILRLEIDAPSERAGGGTP